MISMRKPIARLLTWLLEAVDPKVLSLHFLVSDGTSTHKAKHMTSQIADSGDGNNVVLVASIETAKDNPVAGAPVIWTSSNPLIVTVEPITDAAGQQLRAKITAVGMLGTATITVTSGNVSATDDVVVVAGPAATITLTEAPSAATA